MKTSVRHERRLEDVRSMEGLVVRWKTLMFPH